MEIDTSTPEAFKELYKRHRYKIFYGGRGGGKSWAFAQALVLMAADSRVLYPHHESPQPLRILCARELQNSITESVHRLLSDLIERLGMGHLFDVLHNSIRSKSGSEFLFEGLRHNPSRIKSLEGVNIVWIEEADRLSEHSWEILLPTIRTKDSEIWVSFNPHLKTDPTYQRWCLNPPDDAFVRKVGHRDNPWFTDELRAEMERARFQDEDAYLHIWEGECKTFSDGAIYGKQIKQAREQGRICRIPIQPSCEVHTAWDLGKNDHTAIWFWQRIGPEYRFIDYVENRLVDLDWYVRQLKDRDYLWGRHYLPHDVEHELLGMANSRRRQLEEAGVKPIVVVPRISSVNEGIEMTRRMFASCWFDETKCDEGLEALSAYQYTWDEKAHTHRGTPVHNWASNGADAFRMFAQGHAQTGWAQLTQDDGLSDRRRSAVGSRWQSQVDWRV